jgi:hypothetical protein
MKKALTIILIFVISIVLTTYASAEPPAQIIIRGEEELAEMRRMAEASDEVLIDYLNRTAHSWNGITNREEVIAFLELLDSLPIPYGVGMRFNYLIYYPEFETQNISIFFESEIEEWHGFNFSTDREKEEGVVRRIFGEGVSLLYECQDNRMKIYSPPPIWRPIPDESGNFRFPVEIDGYFIITRYLPEDASTIVPENIYRNMTVSSFREAPWSTISVTFTTSDALTILRAIAGMVTLTDAQIARYGISGEPSTVDAMSILRVVAGL